MQGDFSDPLTWLWLIIWWLIAWLFFFLSLWIVEGKIHAKRKLWATCLIGFIAVLIIPYLQRTETIHWVLGGLGPYIAFFIVIVLIKGLAAEEWSNSVIVSFIGIILLLIINNVFSAVGMNPEWTLFVQ